jgi:hypothetical protein
MRKGIVLYLEVFGCVRTQLLSFSLLSFFFFKLFGKVKS